MIGLTMIVGMEARRLKLFGKHMSWITGKGLGSYDLVVLYIWSA